jgi:hypothetical protein
MRSLKNLSKRLNLYGKTFTTDGYTVYNISKIPDEFKNAFNDETHCWVEWVDGGVDCTWENCIENIKKGIWELR